MSERSPVEHLWNIHGLQALAVIGETAEKAQNKDRIMNPVHQAEAEK